jgi:hypothetical protein
MTAFVAFDATPIPSDLSLLGAAYEEMEMSRQLSLTQRLLEAGKQVRQGTRTWTKQDLKDVARWKHLQPLMSRIEKNLEDIDKSLGHVFEIQNEAERIEALCRIPGIGPALASMILTFTFPDTFCPIDYHAWNGLRSLGFGFMRKDGSGTAFTVSEFFEYLKAVRKLAKERNTTPWEVAKALHALDKVKNRKRWRESFDSINRALTTRKLSISAAPSTG